MTEVSDQQPGIGVEAPDKHFRQRTLGALKWSVLGQTGAQVIRFGLGIVLARLLSPREFGLMGMITVLTGFATLFSELGFGAALVQKKNVTEAHLSSVFWVNMAGGFLLSLITFAAAPFIADFYEEPLLRPLTMIVAVTFLIRSLNTVQQNLLSKSLDFKSRSAVEMVALLLSGAVAIVMAVLGYHVYSLAAQILVTAVVTAVMLWWLSDWRPKLIFDWPAVRELLGFSSNLLGTNVLNYWARNLDNLLIGKYLGSASLGIYTRGYSVMMFPLQNVSRVLSRVMFPSLALIQDDRPRVARMYLRATRMIALVTFPLCFGLWVTAEPFVLTAFGPKWAEVIPILRILSLIGLLQSIGTLNGNLYLSQGRADLQFKLSLVAKTVTILGIVLGLPYGLTGVSTGYAIATLINIGPTYHFAGALVGIGWRDLGRNLGGLLVSSAIMGLAVHGVGLLLPAGTPPPLELAACTLTGILVFGAIVIGLKMEAYRDLVQVYSERKAKKG